MKSSTRLELKVTVLKLVLHKEELEDHSASVHAAHGGMFIATTSL